MNLFSPITVTVSEDFERFLELLGERIELKGWKKYRGGLDVKSKRLKYQSCFETFQRKLADDLKN